MSDWSHIPRDMYVSSASCNDGIVWNAHMCSVPPVLAPEVRYVRADLLSAKDAELVEMARRRDEWRAKAEGYDAVRLALREQVGAPWPPYLSRTLWAGLAADEKKRADDAEAALAARDAVIERLAATLACVEFELAGMGHSCGNSMRALNSVRAARAAQDRAITRTVSRECSECEMDTRAGHHPSCSRYVERDDRCPDCGGPLDENDQCIWLEAVCAGGREGDAR